MSRPTIYPPANGVKVKQCGNSFYCELKSASFSKIILIPIFDNKAPSSGLFLGTHLLPHNVNIETALSIGCGSNLPAELCAISFFGIKHLDCTEVDPSAALHARKTIQLNNLAKYISIKKCSLFPHLLKKYDFIFSDISQMPLPVGVKPNYHDYGGRDGWELLSKIISRSSKYLRKGGYLSLFIFGFLGIRSRTNTRIPSLEERLLLYDFDIVKRTKYRRKIRYGGITHQSLAHIRKVYPKAKFYTKSGKLVEKPEQYISPKNAVYFDAYVITAKYRGD